MNYEYDFDDHEVDFYSENILPDEVFEELFEGEEEFEDFYEEVSDDEEAWENHMDELEAAIPRIIQEVLLEETQELSPEEAREIHEAFPAILAGIGKAVMPMLKTVGTKAFSFIKSNPQVATNLAGGFLGKLFGKKKKKKTVVQQVPVAPQPSPTPVLPVQPAMPRSVAGPPARFNALSLLLNLMQNPQIIRALSSLTSSGQSRPVWVGSPPKPVGQGAILNTLLQLTQQAKAEIPDENVPDALEYLKDETGGFAVDISSPRERADRFLEVFYS